MEKKSALDDWLEEEMRDPEFRQIWEETSPQVSFGLALGTMREQRGMTQQQLANMTGIQRSVIARLENGDHAPTLTTQTKLAHALNARIEVHAEGWIDFVPTQAARKTAGKMRMRKEATA